MLMKDGDLIFAAIGIAKATALNGASKDFGHDDRLSLIAESNSTEYKK